MNNMIERKIRLSDTEEVKEFVRAAGKCDFDIDVCYNRAVIDAKSLLGMLYLGLSKDLTVKYGGQNTGFENTVQKYPHGHYTGAAGHPRPADREKSARKYISCEQGCCTKPRAAALFLCYTV